MLFNSYIFIFLFLPLTLIGWYGLNKMHAYKTAMAFLTGMSLWFYGYFNTYYLLIIISSIAVNYMLSAVLDHISKQKVKKIWLLFGIIFNLGILFYFKYFDFFISNVNTIFKTGFTQRNILLPLGISFFTFQQLSYVIDRYRGDAVHYDILDYAAFVTFFPQLIAGPIVLHDEILPQFNDKNNRVFNTDNFAKGLWIFSIGLGKKVLLADVLAHVVNYGFDNCIYLDSLSTFVTGLIYAFELYFDFSGYSDMAVGLGLMFNIKIVRNFDSPYKACSMKQLWQGWHITLSRFFIKYVYIPMGGSRKGKPRALFNVFFIFMLSGLWHGAAWTFVVWGVIQGLALVWDNLYIIGVKGEDPKGEPKIGIPKLLGQIITFNFFLATLFVFRANSLSDAALMFKNMFSFEYTGSISRLLPYMDVPEFYLIKQVINMKAPQMLNVAYAVIMVLMILLSIFIIASKNAYTTMEKKITPGKWALAAFVFGWSVISFSQVSTFIYFNF